MKRGMFFWFLALMFCAVGCADNANFELENAQIEKREQLREKLSHEVTQAEARENLEKFLLEMKIPSTRGGDAMQLPPITSVYTRGKATLATRAGEAVEPYFHIFNFGDNEGFAIMSGDDRVEPLLALTFEGELTPETEIDNPGFEIAYSRMEDYYIARIGVADTIPSIGFDDPILPGDSLYDPIITIDTVKVFNSNGPCQVKWGNAYPYNNYCTIQPGNVNVPVPSTCVAIAQLMSIYEYPNSYYSYLQNQTYTFNWDEMNLYTIYKQGRPDLNPYLTDSSKYNQIARLYQQLCASANLNVMYNQTNASIPGQCHPDRVPITFTNFGYSSGGVQIAYNTNTVIDELKGGFPVLIGGSEQESVQNQIHRHRWLGHGLMQLFTTTSQYLFLQGWVTMGPFETNYILCNFGMNGNHDGYYLSNAFNTNTGPDIPETRSGEVVEGYYQYNIDAFINIRK